MMQRVSRWVLFGMFIASISNSTHAADEAVYLKALHESACEYNLSVTVGSEDSISSRVARTAFAGFETTFEHAHNTYLFKDPAISQRLFYEYILLSDRILSDFPSTDYIYVGLGGSPTFIMAILETLGINIATRDLSLSLKKDEPINFSSHLEQHVREVFRSPNCEQKKYLIIDYVHTGKSLEKALQIMRRYARKEDHVVALGLRTLGELMPPIVVGDSIFMPNTVSRHIHSSRAKRFRKYPTMTIEDLETSRAPLEVRKEYRQLLEFLQVLYTKKTKIMAAL